MKLKKEQDDRQTRLKQEEAQRKIKEERERFENLNMEYVKKSPKRMTEREFDRFDVIRKSGTDLERRDVLWRSKYVQTAQSCSLR